MRLITNRTCCRTIRRVIVLSHPVQLLLLIIVVYRSQFFDESQCVEGNSPSTHRAVDRLLEQQEDKSTQHIINRPGSRSTQGTAMLGSLKSEVHPPDSPELFTHASTEPSRPYFPAVFPTSKAVHRMLQIVKRDAQKYSESCSKNLKVAQKFLQNLNVPFHIYCKKLVITQSENHFSLLPDY